MTTFAWKSLNSCALASAIALTAAGSLSMLPATAAHAQNSAPARGLPDFTDLVDQVGPSVVNIRTLEKVSASGENLGMDEDMLEFFRRFGLPVPSVPRQRRGQPGAQS